MLAGTSITLIVSGSIAAYKSAELVRELVGSGAKVHVVMTKAATQFITPLTLQTLSGQTVTEDLFDLHRESEISHIALADRADVVLVAPATADLIAKAAAGIADDAATTVLLATKAPVVIAPAMNVNMWEHPITRANVAKLVEHGVRFVEPESGDLACGWVGQGRLAATQAITDAVLQAVTPQVLANTRVVVTAGPTREPLDPVRFLSNSASGKMGYALAAVAKRAGAEVTLISGPSAVAAPRGVNFISVTTAEEMRQAVLATVGSDTGPASDFAEPPAQFVFMAAAVADHRPKAVSATKLKHSKATSYTVEFEPAVDILKELSAERSVLEQRSGTRIALIGFALETPVDDDQLRELARAKLADKGADLIVGNAVESLGSETNRVWLVARGGREETVATAGKYLVAEQIIKAAIQLI